MEAMHACIYCVFGDERSSNNSDDDIWWGRQFGDGDRNFHRHARKFGAPFVASHASKYNPHGYICTYGS